MGKITSIVGIILIAAAGVVAALSANQEDLLKANKELCAKYTKNAEAALASKDFKQAIKFAKQAIKVDPDNKAGFKILDKIVAAKCSASSPAKSETKAAPATNNTPSKAKPAAAEEEEEMGC